MRNIYAYLGGTAEATLRPIQDEGFFYFIKHERRMVMLEKKYNARIREERWQKYWGEIEVYKFNPNSDEEIYSIDTPPPTVNGKLHIGHIFSYTQAEMIARYQRMSGKNVFYPFGFDDNGLPTERLIEKEENIKAKELPRSVFVKKCMETTLKYEEEFKKLWMSLGFSVDWSLQYETISPLAQRISQKSFLDLVKKNRVYVKEMPVLWCTNCQTSIAQAELEWNEKDTSFNWIRFLVEEEEVVIATTRPELLNGCTALFVNPEDARYKQLVGREAVVPLYNYRIPVMADQRVSMDKGSGVVMCATFGDSTDLEWYNEYKLPYRKVIEGNGKITEATPLIGGLGVKESRAKIIALLEENNLLIKTEALSHSAATHERCGHEIEIINSKQWYINILDNKEELLEAGKKINWYPESMRIRYENWVENLKWDWCISRQRYFGVPFPLWYCKSCGEAIFADSENLPINPLEDCPKKACSCGCASFIAEDAVMDTWATSAVTPLINGRWQETDDRCSKILPMSMRTQAHEIIRSWAFYTIVKSLYHTGEIPWRDIMICGFVMAKKGEKISKSKDNSEASPQELIAKHSADTIRYWAANSKLGTDTMFSESELQVSVRFLTKLWNASKFSIMHLNDFDGKEAEQCLPIDKWVLQRLGEVQREVSAFLEKYEIGAARHVVDEFFWGDFCDNYLEIVKDRLYKPELHGYAERRSAQYSLYTVLLEILKLYAIYTPHITEEIYQAFFRDYEETASIHLLKWKLSQERDSKSLSIGSVICELVGAVRKYKSERNLSLKAELTRIKIAAPAEYHKDIAASLKDMMACTSAKDIDIASSSEIGIEIIE